jgi:hypothetical protein
MQSGVNIARHFIVHELRPRHGEDFARDILALVFGVAFQLEVLLGRKAAFGQSSHGVSY